MKKEILEVLHRNVEVSLAIEQNVILEWDFEKVAEELDALFAKRIVASSLPTSTEPCLMITKQIIENADRVIEAIKKANTITISQDTVDKMIFKPIR